MLRKILSLITLRQVIQAGDEYIDALRLNPWCINEGLATGDECIVIDWRADELINEETSELQERIEEAEHIMLLEELYRRDSVKPYTGHGSGPRITQEARQKERIAWDNLQAAKKTYWEKWHE